MGSPVLGCKSLCSLGKKLILSGALMEAGFAAFVQAESEKIEAIVRKYEDNEHATPPTTAEVLKLNEDVKDAIKAIRDVEVAIVDKIDNGKELLEAHDPCPCHCKY